MARNQRQLAVLAALVGVLAAVLVYRYWTSPAVSEGSSSNVTGRAGARAPQARTAGPPPEVRLDALAADRPTPVSSERNLFRFKPKPAPPPPPLPRNAGTVGASPGPPVPTGPPPPPPIALKFIGVLESPDRRQKIAVLRDDRGVYQGKEGDIIEGRYKILHIGVESIDMSYVDGRGRQTIRLTGQ